MICLYFDMKPTYHTMVFYEEILPLFRDEGIDIPRIADFYIRRWVVLDASKQQIVLTSMSKSETLLSVARAYEEGEIELVISNRCIGQRTAIIDITGLFTCCVVRIEEIVIMDGGGDHELGAMMESTAVPSFASGSVIRPFTSKVYIPQGKRPLFVLTQYS